VIELSVPIMLAWRVTRQRWVLVAMAFHFALALDRPQHIYDFSSVLLALFVLFLSDEFATDSLARVRRLAGGVGGPLRVVAAGAAAFCIMAAASTASTERTLIDVGFVIWLVVGLGMLVLTALWVMRRELPPPPPVASVSPAMAVVPALVVLNGLTPYTEVKTANAWNMYSNLRTVGGDTNHYLLPGTVQLINGQDAIYRVVSSDDPGLEYYRENELGLSERQLRGYFSANPDAEAVLRSGDREVRVVAGEPHPFDDPVPEIVRKLAVYRAADVSGAQRCQTEWGPAS
jgi:hypothetical protein